MEQLIAMLLVAIGPWALKQLTELFKNIHEVALDPHKREIVRFVLKVLSFVGAILHAIVSGEPVPETAFQVLIDAVTVGINASVAYYATSGLYFLGKKEDR